MTNTAAAKLTAEIVVDTIRHMAATECLNVNRVFDLLTQGHPATVRRFNAYMATANEYVRKAA